MVSVTTHSSNSSSSIQNFTHVETALDNFASVNRKTNVNHFIAAKKLKAVFNYVPWK